MTLNKLHINQTACIKDIVGDADRRKLFDLGFVPGSGITPIFKSPLGDPTAYLIRGCIMALREEEAEMIVIE